MRSAGIFRRLRSRSSRDSTAHCSPPGVSVTGGQGANDVMSGVSRRVTAQYSVTVRCRRALLCCLCGGDVAFMVRLMESRKESGADMSCGEAGRCFQREVVEADGGIRTVGIVAGGVECVAVRVQICL